jgi:putative glutamine amidotransferase
MKKVLVTLGADMTPTYAEALRRVDVEPVCVVAAASSQQWRAAFAKCSGLLLSGGGDVACERYNAKLSDSERVKFIRGVDTARDEMEITLARDAVSKDMPVLAICRGVQLLNVALGGTLIYDVPTQLSEKLPESKRINHADRIQQLAHGARWEQSSRLVRQLGRDFPQVNTSHHQALDRVADKLTVIARAPDGVIEAVENPEARFLVGVQFHPERLVDDHPEFLELFRLFRKAI